MEREREIERERERERERASARERNRFWLFPHNLALFPQCHLISTRVSTQWSYQIQTGSWRRKFLSKYQDGTGNDLDISKLPPGTDGNSIKALRTMRDQGIFSNLNARVAVYLDRLRDTRQFELLSEILLALPSPSSDTNEVHI